MRCERLTLTGEPEDLAAQLRSLVPPAESVTEDVAEIIAGVRAGGDDAIREYTRRFDAATAGLGALAVGAEDLEAGRDSLDPAVRSGLAQAIENVRAVSEAWMREAERTVTFPSH